MKVLGRVVALAVVVCGVVGGQASDSPLPSAPGSESSAPPFFSIESASRPPQITPIPDTSSPTTAVPSPSQPEPTPPSSPPSTSSREPSSSPEPITTQPSSGSPSPSSESPPPTEPPVGETRPPTPSPTSVPGPKPSASPVSPAPPTSEPEPTPPSSTTPSPSRPIPVPSLRPPTPSPIPSATQPPTAPTSQPPSESPTPNPSSSAEPMRPPTPSPSPTFEPAPVPSSSTGSPAPPTVRPPPSTQPPSTTPAPVPTTTSPRPSPTTQVPVPPRPSRPVTQPPTPTTTPPPPGGPLPTPAPPAPSPAPPTTEPDPTSEPAPDPSSELPLPPPVGGTRPPTPSPSPEPEPSPSPVSPPPPMGTPRPTTRPPPTPLAPSTTGSPSSPAPPSRVPVPPVVSPPPATLPPFGSGGPTSPANPRPSPPSNPRPSPPSSSPGSPPSSPSLTPIPLPNSPSTPRPDSPSSSEDRPTSNKGDTSDSKGTNANTSPPSTAKDSSSGSPPANETPSGSTPQSTEATARPYERGDQVIVIQTPTTAPDGSGSTSDGRTVVVVNPSRSPADVIGGNEVNGGTNSSKDVAGRSVYRLLQYLTSVVALVSCLLWMMQYVIFPASGAAVSWEFVLFVGYAQRMASLSHVVAHSVPYFLWEYVDAFSWTVFVPFHKNVATESAQRRLDEEAVVVLDGVVAFADRIGMKESTLLNRGVIGMLVAVGVVGLVIIVAWFIKLRVDSKPSHRHTLELPDTWSSEDQKQRNWLHRLGRVVPVMLWLLALYPMALLSSFEIAMEIRSNDANAASLTVALLVVVFGIIAFAFIQVRSALNKANQDVIGKSSDESFFAQPSLLAGLIVVQIVSGITVGAVRSPVAQLVVLMVLVVAFHGFAWQWIRSTTQPSSTKWIILALGLVQVVNLGLSFAFVSSLNAASITESSHSVAVAYIILNSVVILAIFARQFGLMCQQFVMIWDDQQRTRKDSQSMSDNSTTFVVIATPLQKHLSL